MKCKNCSKNLFDPRQKFCSIDCQDDYIINLEERIREAVKNDHSHIQRMSHLE